ncbi:MAG: SH3 domain-containing protein [Desulfobaccales bacterium]
MKGQRGARWPVLRLVFLVLAGMLVSLGPGMAETLKVERPDTQMYAAPNFGSASVGVLPVGAEVAVVSRSGDWVQVNYQGNTGWINKTAFPQARGPGLGLPGMLTGGPVRETKSDEVALAGKGFTPEVEAAYRQKNPGMNYAQVDQIERFQVDAAQLASFIREGGLTP